MKNTNQIMLTTEEIKKIFAVLSYASVTAKRNAEIWEKQDCSNMAVYERKNMKAADEAWDILWNAR